MPKLPLLGQVQRTAQAAQSYAGNKVAELAQLTGQAVQDLQNQLNSATVVSSTQPADQQTGETWLQIVH